VRSRLALVSVAAVLTVAVVALSLRHVDPFPPRRKSRTCSACSAGRPTWSSSRAESTRSCRTRREPLQHHYHGRAHVSLVLAEARDRLRRLERAPAV
jgi:hypothetical protein